MTDQTEVSKGDPQVLTETVFNERLVTHPKLGQIRLRLPNLEIQRKIDAVGRAKKKFLKEARDTVTAEDGTITRVPAYKSREQLGKEYADLGWWTEVEKLKLADLHEQHVQLLAELELLNFDSDTAIYIGLKEIFTKLLDFCKDEKGDVPNEVVQALDEMIIPGTTLKISNINLIKENSATTEVDDLIDQLTLFHKQYNAYVKLAQVYTDLVSLQSQQSQLFSDSWQDQLQYYLRLAQVFYCTEKTTTSKPIWPSLDAIEAEQDIELIRWIFGELNAFWQGISDETREKMNKYSFTIPRNTEPSPSDASPVPQDSSLDGGQQEKTQELSTVATVTAEISQTDKSN